MHDARALIDSGQDAVTSLARRGFDLDLIAIEGIFSQRNEAIKQANDLRAEAKQIARQVGQVAASGQDPTSLKDRARGLKDEIRTVEARQETAESQLRELMLTIPNFPADDSPTGPSEEFNEVRKVHGPIEPFTFPARDHVELAEKLGIIDFPRAAKLSGARFTILRGAGARLERALANFFLERNRQQGYEEVSVPFLVNRATMTGTGQLPKFEEDLFKTGVADRDLYLLPTAEVPLTNLHAGEVLTTEDLPLAYTACTPCFRSEAGSYGRDTRGIIRLHQFSKVELVRLCRAEESRTELELMLGQVEACLQELELSYRVVALATGDLGFSAQFTFDLEVWFPSQGAYREISSCSDCGTFQSRRANIRSKAKNGDRGAVATLNGSALPLGRTIAALLEQQQQPDGSVRIPAALVPFTGFSRITADGTES